MKEIILFRCHNQNARTLDNYKRLSGACSNVKMIYDATNKLPLEDAFNVTLDNIVDSDLPVASPEYLKRSFPQDYEFAIKNENNFKSWHNKMQMWYNPGHSVILYYLQNPDFDYYWSIEYDVFFRRDWKNFFIQYENDNSDFLGCALNEYNENHSLYKHYAMQYEYKKPMLSYGIVHRYSKRLLEAVYQELLKGNFAYYEILFPSVATEYGFIVNDLNSKGRIVYWEQNIMGNFKDLDVILHTMGGDNQLFHRVS